MSVLMLAAFVAIGASVPTPRDFPANDFIGGPLNGLMAELRGEKTQPPTPHLSAVIDELFGVGNGETQHDLKSLVTEPAIHSFESVTHPDSGWSGKIEPGFLSKFEGCVHTAPWFDGAQGDVQNVHFYWSCDKENPYILRTDIRLLNEKVKSWKASEPPRPVIVDSNQRVRD